MILAYFKILAFQNPHYQTLAAFKTLGIQNAGFQIFGDFKFSAF